MKTAKTVLIATLLVTAVACGYTSKPITPPAAGTMPTIAGLAPNSAPAGSSLGVNGLVVNGTSFNANATINWNGAALVTSFVSSGQLMATVPDTDVATAGTAAVTVTNPGTSGGIYGGGTASATSSPMTFTIN